MEASVLIWEASKRLCDRASLRPSWCATAKDTGLTGCSARDRRAVATGKQPWINAYLRASAFGLFSKVENCVLYRHLMLEVLVGLRREHT